MTPDFCIVDTVANDDVYDISGGFRLPDFRYEDIKDIVASIIERYQIHTIPVDVFELVKRIGIQLVPFSKLTVPEKQALAQHGITPAISGFCALGTKLGQPAFYIYYNDSNDWGRIRFTILHEIGHIVLGHLQQSDLAEAESDFFAKYFIAPPVLVDKIKPTDYLEIAEVFQLSDSCAWNSFDYYQKWCRHHYRTGLYKSYESRILRACTIARPA